MLSQPQIKVVLDPETSLLCKGLIAILGREVWAGVWREAELRGRGARCPQGPKLGAFSFMAVCEEIFGALQEPSGIIWGPGRALLQASCLSSVSPSVKSEG